MTPEDASPPDNLAAESHGIEAFLEGTVGLNFRSLRTLADLFWKPVRVFRTYADPRQTRYMPALRLWLGLTVVMAILTYFFGDQGDLIRRAIGNWPDAQRDSLLQQINGDLDGFAEAYGRIFPTLQPIIVGIGMIVPVLLTALFSRGLAWVSRINLSYAVLNAGSVLGLMTFPVMVQHPEWGMWAILPVALVYWLTFYRGAPGTLATSQTGRIVKASLFTSVTIIMVVISGFVTVIASLILAAREVVGG